MRYNIAVCIKPVPDPKYYDRVTIDPVKKTITRAGIPQVFNQADKHALELGISLREKHGGKVIVFSMAPPEAGEILREALAMGADSAYLLSDRAFAGADTLATSYTLYMAIKKIQSICSNYFDFVLCGCESADGATAQVSSQLGEWLEIPHLWNVFAFEKTAAQEGEQEKETFIVKTKIENGHMEWRAAPPIVMGIAREINKPRFISVTGIMKAKSKPLVVWGKSDINAADSCIGLKGSPTQPGEIFSPETKRSGKLLAGNPEEIAAKIIKVLRSSGVE